MAGNSTISITYKLEGDNSGFKTLTVDAEGLRKVLEGSITEAERFKKSIVNFAALSTGIDSLNRSISGIQAKIKDLSDAYAVQETAERKLETVMRQRMGATDEPADGNANDKADDKGNVDEVVEKVKEVANSKEGREKIEEIKEKVAGYISDKFGK